MAWWTEHYSTDPTKTRAWRTLRDQVIRDEPACQLAFPGICTHISTTADHKIPKTDRPDLAITRDNLQGACWPCNERKGNMPPELLPTSEQPARPKALSIFD